MRSFALALGALIGAFVSGVAAQDAYWLEGIKHQGIAAFNADPANYQVFRNVKDFGAVGDGTTDDTAAINDAISSGDRCGQGCNSSSVMPALVYFPSGTYLVKTPIIPFYYTQLVGDAKNMPTLLADAGFTGMAVIDADPYIEGGNGANWWVNQNNFFKSVRNFKIDLTQMPSTASATGLHWQVSQATSLSNVVVEMSDADDTAHQGIFMENGSGGYMGDLTFNGGKYGIWVGNQQFTVKNVVINNAKTAVFGIWNWGWTFQGITIKGCGIGFELTTGGLTEDEQTVGAEAIIDATVTDTPIFIQNSVASSGSLAGSLVLNNVVLDNVPTAVGVADGTVVLEGGSTTIQSWGQGNVYTGTGADATFTQGDLPNPKKDDSLLADGKIFGRLRPQYEDTTVDQIVSARDAGAKGDGSTDDTDALQKLFDDNAGSKVIFLDAGTYIVTKTLTIPAGAQIVGEVWSVIAGKGDAFSDVANPSPVVRVGEDGAEGTVEITDVNFSTVGPAAGAIVVEWNIHEPAGTQGGAGAWDCHIRLAGALGTELQPEQCPTSGGDVDSCYAAFMGLHITSKASAYLEGMWVWLADHDLDGDGYTRISAWSGRGILSESQGPVWLIGTGSEHHAIYEYGLVGAKNHYLGLIQTETPYYQPQPKWPGPFELNTDFKDPEDTGVTSAWGLYVKESENILIFGAGLYSFFDSYTQDCLDAVNCQSQMVSIDDASTINIFSLATVGVENQISINGEGVVKASNNKNGLQQTVTSWAPA